MLAYVSGRILFIYKDTQMGEETSGGIVSKLIEKAGEQGFSYIVMGVVCWTMYSMIVQNNEDTQNNINELRDELSECQNYNKELIDQLINEKE